MDRPRTRETLVLLGVAVAWLLLVEELGPLGIALLPASWKAHLTLRSFLMICQLVTVAAGVGLCAALLAKPWEALALRRPRPALLLSAALLSPALFVVSSVVALRIALPTLMEELATRGPGASQENAGAFGRTLEQGPILLTLLWGALLAATTEEVLFRGALWSAVQRLLPPPAAAPAKDPTEEPSFITPSPFEEAWSWVLAHGVVPTLVAAAVFGWMHHDTPGGVGIVRVAAATCLGLACGVARQATGSLATPVLLHFLNNTTAIAQGRGWIRRGPEPWIDGVPDTMVAVGGAGIAAVLLGALVMRARSRARAALPGATAG